MDERRVQCEFFSYRSVTDKKPHQPIHWNLSGKRNPPRVPCRHSGPETFYRGDALVPGEYEDNPGSPPISDVSRR